MIFPEIEKLIIKFFHKSISINDLEVLNDWIKKLGNESIFKDYIKTHYAITLGLNDSNLGEIKENLLTEIRKENNKYYRNRFKLLYKYAALVLLFLGIGYLFQHVFFEKREPLLTLDEKTITLKLENGDIQVISADKNINITDVSGKTIMQQQGARLVYSKDIEFKSLKYNTLTIPKGKRFDIVLSDGTHIFLNSESSIKYPIKFIPGHSRKVFLEGEAFFDVIKDENHPFLIEAQGLEVKVLGTKFNVSNYPDNIETEIVLVEGAVSLNSSENKLKDQQDVILKPGSKATFNTSNHTISTQNVNTSLYTSWIKGIIVFRNTPFDKIAKTLERQYNVIITNNNKALAKETFNASFEIENETINDVLHYFNKVHQMNYEINDNKIIIE